MISIKDLTVRYDSLVAVNGISLDVGAGEIFGLVGPNGAGKTTTLKVVSGLLLPDGGDVRVDGLDVVSKRHEVRTKLGYMADFFGVYDYLTVHEYLAFFGGMYGVEDQALDTNIASALETVNLVQKRDSFVKTLSRGMKQRLYFARMLVHSPKLLILDEPASGMDPRGRSELIETLRRVNREGKTIVISSHILEELQALCTSVGVMEAGRLVGIRKLQAASAESRRHVLLCVVEEDLGRAAGWLAHNPEVFSFANVPGGLALEVKDDDSAVSALVRDMVGAGIRVLLPKSDASDLREIFLKMTKGELM